VLQLGNVKAGAPDNRFDLLLREESDISQVARNRLGWLVAYNTGQRPESGSAQSLGLSGFGRKYSQLLSYPASKHC
jgi:hypothetical protein